MVYTKIMGAAIKSAVWNVAVAFYLEFIRVFAEAVCTYHFDENRMNTISYSFANSIIERVRFCARLKTFSDVDSKSAQADM